MSRRIVKWMMTSTRLQLLVTAVAALAALAIFNAKGPPPTMPLLWDRVDSVRGNLNWGADVNRADEAGLTPLHCAVMLGDPRYLIAFLIDHGADVHAKTAYGWTPLHFAASDRDEAIAELLIAKGASIHCKDINGDTPLGWAVNVGNKVTAQLLVAKGAEIDFHAACLLGREDKVAEFLVSRPQLAEVKTTSGLAPLHLADDEAVAARLLAAGADVNVRNRQGRTPLFLAAREGRKEFARYLIAHGADVNAPDERKFTPLYWAAARGDRALVELLLAHGADVHARTVDGNTPLDRAKRAKNKEVIALLRQHGAAE